MWRRGVDREIFPWLPFWISSLFLFGKLLPVVPCRGSWFAHAAILSLSFSLSKPSHPHPDPWTPTVAEDIFSFIFWNEPKSRLMASISSPRGKNAICICWLRSTDVQSYVRAWEQACCNVNIVKIKSKGSLQHLWPCGSSPPFGDRFVQKMEWLMWPPPLNLSGAWRATCVVTSPVGDYY